VIIPTLTYISCALAVLYNGATPVLVDSEPLTGNMDIEQIAARITPRTRAIMPVHLYGHPVDMDPLLVLARTHRLKVVEDAAEVHGAEYKGRRVGGLGDVGCFSFYANKIVTTGEGGMLVTSDPDLADRARRLRNLAHSPQQRFVHDMLGFNYRLTNVQAAIGLGQLERIEESIAKKRWMAETYRDLLSDIPGLTLPTERSYARSVYWMYAMQVNERSPLTRDALMNRLRQLGVDTRSYFVPIHRQPVFCKDESGGMKEESRRMKFMPLPSPFLLQPSSFPVAEDLARRGFYIPSGLAITEAQMSEVSDALHRLMLP
jgi:perosamine synthetase